MLDTLVLIDREVDCFTPFLSTAMTYEAQLHEYFQQGNPFEKPKQSQPVAKENKSKPETVPHSFNRDLSTLYRTVRDKQVLVSAFHAPFSVSKSVAGHHERSEPGSKEAAC